MAAALPDPFPETAQKTSVRRDTILDAARDVFSQKGFELTTMQDIAAASKMSAGNIYRYFASKSEVVSGLVERDRAQMADRFAELAKAPDQIEGFEVLGRQHLKQECHAHAKLTLEIWAVSSRRPELRQLCQSMEESVTADLKKYMNRLAAENRLAPNADPDLICHLIMTLAQSMFRESALNPQHDIDRDLDAMFAVVGAAMAGLIKVPEKTQRIEKAAE